MKTKQWIFMAVWFIAYNATLQFFRFQIGVLEISIVFMAIGVLAALVFIWKTSRPK